jgi:hypothetical protein
MAMTQKIAMVYTHVQDTPDTLWTINHKLGIYPIVDCYVTDNGVNQKILPSAITFVDLNTCTVTFTAPIAGHATVV